MELQQSCTKPSVWQCHRSLLTEVSKNNKTRSTLECRKTLGHLTSINRNMVIHFANQSQTCQLLKNFKNLFFKHFMKRNCEVVQSIPGWTDTENPYRLSRASYIYIYKICRVLAIHFNHLSQCTGMIGIYRVGDNRRTINTSTTPHISDQLWTENECKTLLCWFIVVTWALFSDNMYRYGRHFRSFYRNPTILETVSPGGFDCLGQHGESFLLKYNDKK